MKRAFDDDLLDELIQTWAAEGAAAITLVRERSPGVYVQMVARIVRAWPEPGLVAGLEAEDFDELVHAVRFGR